MDVPKLTLNNGIQMPALGLGVYLSGQDKTAQAVECAIRNGYRLIDTASAYGNEKEVGEGIVRAGCERSELFVTTKLWLSDYGHHETLAAFEASLARLSLEYVDLYLLHWPSPSTFERTIAAYRAAETLLADGRIRALGVCNFQPVQLERLRKETTVVPAVNQIELHPYFSQESLRIANSQHGTVTQCWSPIGGIFTNHPANPEAPIHLLADPYLKQVAERIERTPAQVVLRWHIQHGLSAIPKSVNPDRIRTNIEIFDFELSQEEMAGIDRLNTGVRSGPAPEVFDLDFLAARAEATAS